MIVSWLLSAIATQAVAPSFQEKPCADQRIAQVSRCGTVRVLESRDIPDGRVIDLNVIIVQAETPTAGEAALFDIDGGPGLPATKNAEFYALYGAALRANRDIVIIDQRGTGGSNPLACPALSAPENAYRPQFPVEAVVACRADLERKADLRRYGTREAVADLDEVRRALGYDKIKLFGLSYGSTVALRYIAAHPNRVSAAILMGVAPADAMPPAKHATVAHEAMRLLFARCRREPECGSTFAPEDAFVRALSRLPTIDGAPEPEVFAEKIRSLMYQPASASRIPLILHHAATGDLKPFYDATKPQGPSPYFDGMFLSVTCAEGLALMNFDAASRAARGTPFGDYRLRRQKAACDRWPAAHVSPDHLKPVNSDVPVLLLSGELDPVTPPRWAETAASTLRNSKHVIIPGSGHVFDGMSGVETCLEPLMVTFLKSEDARSLDVSCVASMKAPPFATFEAKEERKSQGGGAGL